MSDFNEIPEEDEHTKSIEARRAMLRRAIKRFPDQAKFQDALRKSVNATYIRRAAKNGVFICYSQADDVFTLNLAIELREAGVRVFMDELDVPDNQDWGHAVNKALHNCGVLLLILSPDAIRDAEMQGERTYFLRKGKIIVPVIARACSTKGLETYIEPIDFETDERIAKHKLLSLLRLHEGTDAQSE